MITYKLFRVKNDKLYPLYVEADREMEIGIWLRSGCGQIVDETHVKARGCSGKLRLREGWHSTNIPFTDWIGKKYNNILVQRNDTVWCECVVKGKQIENKTREGYDFIPKDSWYYFKTNSKQRDPWIISDWIKVNRILSNDEVKKICYDNNIKPQPLESEVIYA